MLKRKTYTAADLFPGQPAAAAEFEERRKNACGICHDPACDKKCTHILSAVKLGAMEEFLDACRAMAAMKPPKAGARVKRAIARVKATGVTTEDQAAFGNRCGVAA